MMNFDSFGWAELISLAAVAISFLTIYTSTKIRSAAEYKSDQQVLDKLNNLESMTKDTNQDVKAINKKIDDHSERLASLEAEMKNAFYRIKRVEDTQDNCQACRSSKEQLSQHSYAS